MSCDLSTLNAASAAEFTRLVGPVFEHSPWIAERAAAERPFKDISQLHRVLCQVVEQAKMDEQLALICAHPDLVGRVVLTAESQNEQQAAGLGNLRADEIAQFERYNREYKDRFGFPFVICARLNRKDAILAAFPVRLQNTAGQERATALGEIFKIAWLRLQDLVTS